LSIHIVKGDIKKFTEVLESMQPIQPAPPAKEQCLEENTAEVLESLPSQLGESTSTVRSSTSSCSTIQPEADYKQVTQTGIYYPHKLLSEFQLSRFALPQNLIQARNISILLSFIEPVCMLLLLPLA